jgi:AraC-like DNA-binding protein
VEEHLEASLTLGQLAAVARLSVYHFARQFRRATGLPPHQYVLARRVERAQQVLQRNRHRFLAELAARAGLSDQSQLTRHFKRLVGVAPWQFRTRARIAKKGQVPPRNGRASPLTIPHEQSSLTIPHEQGESA